MFTECSGKEQETLQYRTRGEKTKDGAASFPPVRSQNRAGRKELLHYVKWHISRRVPERRSETRALYSGDAHSREGSYILPLVFAFARKNGTSSPVNHDDFGGRERRERGEGGGRSLVLTENRFQWGARVDGEASSFRARESDAE